MVRLKYYKMNPPHHSPQSMRTYSASRQPKHKQLDPTTCMCQLKTVSISYHMRIPNADSTLHRERMHNLELLPLPTLTRAS